jgi:hypothetical protein
MAILSKLEGQEFWQRAALERGIVTRAVWREGCGRRMLCSVCEDWCSY